MSSSFNEKVNERVEKLTDAFMQVAKARIESGAKVYCNDPEFISQKKEFLEFAIPESKIIYSKIISIVNGTQKRFTDQVERVGSENVSPESKLMLSLVEILSEIVESLSEIDWDAMEGKDKFMKVMKEKTSKFLRLFLIIGSEEFKTSKIGTIIDQRPQEEILVNVRKDIEEAVKESVLSEIMHLINLNNINELLKNSDE